MAKKKSKPEVVEVEAVEESEEVVVAEAEKPVEAKPEQFKNNSDKGMKIKLIDGKNFKWITVKPGESVTIPRKLAIANGLAKVE